MSDYKIRVSVITDQPLLARGLAEVVSRAPGMAMLEAEGSAGLTPRADVALVDVPADASEQELADLLGRVRAEQVIVWAGPLRSEMAAVAVLSGVRGILRKQAPPEEVVRCLARVAAGELWLEARWLGALRSTESPLLTGRERQLLGLLTQGLKNKEIAHIMRVGEPTVKTYLSKLFRKVRVGGRFELACYALQHGPRSHPTGRAA